MVGPVSRNGVEPASGVDVAIVETPIEVAPVANRRIGAMRSERPILHQLESAVLPERSNRVCLLRAVEGCAARHRQTEQGEGSAFNTEVHANAGSIQQPGYLSGAIEASKES